MESIVSGRHLTSPESRFGVVFKTTNVCTNSSTTFASVWTLSSETKAAASLEVVSERQERLQWGNQQRNWVHEWLDVLFSDESRFCLQHQDRSIHVWLHRGKRTLTTCIRHRHTSPSPGVML
ncbi:transposable element Tcb1 transposase [Trichonephila clavipes]|nr:transposable element Tcb1 transposase [Trichonephila clavipes]